ncbi:SDR family oxidoreductase [Thiohalobacter sp. IOR34]|uniref:SDR family oxidoreductase n=1 Tax=Thiohalobacter sp. IOR34 TaxID=3057176 RepID=UPI0025B1A0E9|nr:SDR family oxidoreductase [Thiohalobacter sp. IOR34]WJW74603.1 SDR family oxidoreductase [Thiohalobacter sp. IOR34]
MRILVTGGAGFIGSYVVEQLLAKDHAVRVVDNLEGGRLDNLRAVAEHPQFEFHQTDIRDADSLGRAFAGVDWVIHLAGIADIVPSIEQPRDYFATNVQGTLNVIEAARQAGVKRIVYAASSSCYGIPDEYPTPETSPARPEYPYALTKYLGEQLVGHWGRVYGLETVSLRLFNVYGPRVRTNGAYGAVFGVFLAQKANGRPLTVVGDGTQSRDFTYVEDVARAFVMAVESDLAGEILNVGSGGHYSINRLVELIGGEVVHVPKRPGEPDCTFADTRLIRERLGWEPAIDFDDGVARMLASIDDWQDAPLWDPDSIQDATRSWFRFLGGESAC